MGAALRFVVAEDLPAVRQAREPRGGPSGPAVEGSWSLGVLFHLVSSWWSGVIRDSERYSMNCGACGLTYRIGSPSGLEVSSVVAA